MYVRACGTKEKNCKDLLKLHLMAGSSLDPFTNDELLKLFTYDHRTLQARLPVRSALVNQCIGGLVVRWVTTGESPLLYVFLAFIHGLVGWLPLPIQSH